MSLADEENVQPLLSEQDVETGEPVTEPAPEIRTRIEAQPVIQQPVIQPAEEEA